MIERDAIFRKPIYFDDKLQEVKKKIASRGIKFSTGSTPVGQPTIQQQMFSQMMVTGGGEGHHRVQH